MVNDIFSKLDLFKEIKEELNQTNSSHLSQYLQTKVSKVDRAYLELLCGMLFDDLQNKDQVIQMISSKPPQQNISKKVYKTVIQPKYNIIPFNVKCIENILNRNFSQESRKNRDGSIRFTKTVSTQTGVEKGVSKIAVSIAQNSSLEEIK